MAIGRFDVDFFGLGFGFRIGTCLGCRFFTAGSFDFGLSAVTVRFDFDLYIGKDGELTGFFTAGGLTTSGFGSGLHIGTGDGNDFFATGNLCSCDFGLCGFLTTRGLGFGSDFVTFCFDFNL